MIFRSAGRSWLPDLGQISPRSWRRKEYFHGTSGAPIAALGAGGAYDRPPSPAPPRRVPRCVFCPMSRAAGPPLSGSGVRGQGCNEKNRTYFSRQRYTIEWGSAPGPRTPRETHARPCLAPYIISYHAYHTRSLRAESPSTYILKTSSGGPTPWPRCAGGRSPRAGLNCTLTRRRSSGSRVRRAIRAGSAHDRAPKRRMWQGGSVGVARRGSAAAVSSGMPVDVSQ